ncbi:MAG: Coenzyme F420 hydrogenase/dehydrogenase, beta subunit C-terminal domain [Muribaculaceae bacterium]|nr:Coenzyme F420 hydrogenase/dehydrogenase, beta subunit C-terminal domain [Muribaculaceae bacterium]
MNEAKTQKGYLETYEKDECFGCEACIGVCAHTAIAMHEDEEGFRYPVIDEDRCVHCGLCNRVCPSHNMPDKNPADPFVFGGHIKNEKIRDQSTSGGIFSALAETWSKDGNYVIFGAYSDKLEVYHGYITDIKDLGKFRKSKYSQSHVGSSYQDVRRFIKEGRRVIFSGTPCQMAGLKNVLGRLFNSENLLTIEVVCEGFPSPLFIRKYVEKLQKQERDELISLDYRFKDVNRWDFECMEISFKNGKRLIKDRWFSPFWVFWARRLMSRPSCEKCPFRTPQRIADITLGDLWGVQKYCPDLYDGNKGATLTVCNTEKGKYWFKRAEEFVTGRELDFSEALKFQRPMRVIVPGSPDRNRFMNDLINLDYDRICKKWNGKEPLKVLWKKYIWGNNRQVVTWYKIKQGIKKLFR